MPAGIGPLCRQLYKEIEINVLCNKEGNIWLKTENKSQSENVPDQNIDIFLQL